MTPVPSRLPRTAGLLLATALLAPEPGTAREPAKDRSAAPAASTELSERELAWHVLSRLGYGPRPGQVEQVLAVGPERYIEEQLDAATRPEPELERRLAALPLAGLSPAELERRLAGDRDGGEARRRERRESGLRGRERPISELDPGRRVVAELALARVLRAVLGERQLEAVLVDFWFNHFNVDARKGRAMPYLLAAYEARLRQHALGRFEDLLVATARSPAMLLYLDNWLSVDREAAERLGGGRTWRRGLWSLLADGPPKGQGGFFGKAKGLNENYARELLELHTLGVDGGYTQTDVQEVARCFTGWSLRKPEEGAAFVFRAELHDRGTKHVLGHTIEAGGGLSDGLQVLRLLARHPATARHLSRKLAVRFVSDEPPEGLIQRLSARFLESGGQIREVLALLFASPEFRAREAFEAKVKTPLELVVSALRATGARPGTRSPALIKALLDLNQPLYLCQPPTGWSDVGSTWTNAGAMLARMEFATRLASGRIEGAGELRALEAEASDPAELARRLLGREASPELLQTLADPEVQSLELDRAPAAEELWERAFRERLGERVRPARTARPEWTVAALVLGSPDFQKR